MNSGALRAKCPDRLFVMIHLFVSASMKPNVVCDLLIHAGRYSMRKSRCFVTQNEQKSLCLRIRLFTVAFLPDECLSCHVLSFG